MTQLLSLPVLVAALGYFVDIFDLYLFGVVRVASLKDLGVPPEMIMGEGMRLLNAQMLGVLVGGIFWGILGDRKGRVSVLFGSILIYSLANLANAFVRDTGTYAALRFIGGFGLAGELGLAITLVSEILPTKVRGYGTTLVASVGLCGSVAAALIADALPWRVAYVVGGAMGLALLALRVRIHDPALFARTKKTGVKLGRIDLIFRDPRRLARYLGIIAIGVPIWFAGGLLITFSPEYARELGVTGAVTAGQVIFYTYIGVAVGDLASGVISQIMGSRRRAIALFLLAECLIVALLMKSEGLTPSQFFAVYFALGFATGYWAVFMTTAAELFGTNIRATVTTSVPNFVRGMVVPLTLSFTWLRGAYPLRESTMLLGGLCVAAAAVALFLLPETYGRDLDFVD